MNPMLEIRKLRKDYSGSTVVDVPSLTIAKGERLGVVGNNGAGKTTLFRLVLDLVAADGGEVLSGGEAVAGSEHWKSYTGSYLDDSFLIDFLFPEEYFAFVGELYGVDGNGLEPRLSAFDEFFRGQILGRTKLIRELSQGNRKKVGLAAALLASPEIVVLDEPFPNLDPSSVIRLKELLLGWHAERSMTILVSSHNLTDVTDLCDRIVILEDGRLVKDLRTGPETLRELEDYFDAQ